MILNAKTLEKLRLLINEETEYRSGPKLVKFFNELGFRDSYGQGFPSRWAYTDSRLESINGTPQLDQCIRNVFHPANYIGRIDELDSHIRSFNQYLAFDLWKVVRSNTEIRFQKIDRHDLPEYTEKEPLESFLDHDYENVSFSKIDIDGNLVDVLEGRLAEIKKCVAAEAYLSVVIMTGSTLEGVLLGHAIRHPRQYNSASTSPKDSEGKVKILPKWTLAELINTSKELGVLKDDVSKFSHALRDFRNYVHPFQQMSTGFEPDQYTAKICFQVLKAALHQIAENTI